MTQDSLPGDRPSLLIDLGAVARNYLVARDAFTGASLGAVVKKDAYGLGAARIAPLLHRLGCRDFWVADLEEAVDLRRVLPDGRIFVLHGLTSHDPAAFAAIGAVPVLLGMEEIARAAACAGRPQVALHLDTGLNRLGIGRAEVRALAAAPEVLARLDIAAHVTHLAFFSDPVARENRWQWLRFRAWTRHLPPAPLSFCASAGVFGPPERHVDLARVGSALYGVDTTPRRPQPIVPAATLSAPIVKVDTVRAGTRVGYGGAYCAPGPRRLAHVAAGYAAGIPFTFRKPAHVLIDGHRAQIVAGTAMSLMTVDVTDLPPDSARPGARAILFGPDHPVTALAEAAGLAPNVVMVAAGRGVRRVYRDPPLPRAGVLQPSGPRTRADDERIAGADGDL
ncbi:alanine racemase [Aquabacter spiritensis]|uniref:alanine racemase n=1 Tax=Aquabacter spiritensis TaxID=933073 RepID=A0A4R3M9E4_9HYPH|nr:alanine racemase [Aquabacter spiritensis]TCT07995.1 alanine racemase [Aquabacter spiritensis]